MPMYAPAPPSPMSSFSVKLTFNRPEKFEYFPRNDTCRLNDQKYRNRPFYKVILYNPKDLCRRLIQNRTVQH